MLTTLKADLDRYRNERRHISYVLSLASTQAIWAITVYRFGNWTSHLRWPLVDKLLRLIYRFLNKVVEILTGISISATATIGPGLYIGHFGGIFIHPNTVIGRGCNIAQGVTIGTRGRGESGVPRIGDNVFIGAGAKLLGGISIGDKACIGANAVVIDDIPPGATAVGVPATIVKIEGKKVKG